MAYRLVGAREYLDSWGYEVAYERDGGATTFVLAMPRVTAAAGVHVDEGGRVTVVESRGLEEGGFESDDRDVRRAALLGLVDGTRPEAEWGEWRLAARISDPDDPAWYAILWELGLAGGVVSGRDARPTARCALAAAVDALGGADTRAALLGRMPDDTAYLPYPILGIAHVLADGGRVADARRRAMAEAPFFARTMADHVHLLGLIDEGGDVYAALGSPALWGVGCRSLRPEPAWKADRVSALARVPFPPLANVGSLVAAAAAVPANHVPATEADFRAFEVVVSALDETPSFRADFYRGSSGLRHDLGTLLSPAKGRWMHYLARTFMEAGPGAAPTGWRTDLAASDPGRQEVVLASLTRLLRRCLDVGEAFAKEVLVPFMVVEYDVMASSAETVNGWRSLGSAALFRGEGLLQLVRVWRRWSSGSGTRGLAARLGPVSWPAPFGADGTGEPRVSPIMEASAFAGRDGIDGEPLERHLFDAAAGRCLVLDVGSSGRVTSTAVLTLSLRGDSVDVDLLWHSGPSGGAPTRADMAAVARAMRVVDGTSPGLEAGWLEWLRLRRTKGGDYAWLMPDSDYRFDDEALRRVAFEWWRPCMPKGVEDHSSFVYQDIFAPDVTAAMRHLKAAGILLFPHWRRSIRSALD